MAATQLPLFPGSGCGSCPSARPAEAAYPATATLPDLGSYDLVLVNSSAGKDSQAMLDYLVGLAAVPDAPAGLLDRFLVVHADLGRVEWKGTRELAEAQAAHYGLRFVAVSRPQGDLLDQIEARGMFPDNSNRYCTSDQKTGQVLKVMTAEVNRLGLGRPARILNCLGIRAQESPARAKKAPFGLDSRASNGRRHVDRWYPIFGWTLDQVWRRIRESGVAHHPAYDLGMPRLSCCFCVLSSKGALVLAAKHNPELAAEYVRVEAKIGHRFRNDLSMADIVVAAQAGEAAEVQDWSA